MRYGKYIEVRRKKQSESQAYGLTCKEKDIVFISGTRNIERNTNLGGVFWVPCWTEVLEIV